MSDKIVQYKASVELECARLADEVEQWKMASQETARRLAEANARMEELHLERDLAIAHDRQPYPTADAYEKTCAALHKAQAENAKLREALEDLGLSRKQVLAALRGDNE